MNTQEKLDYDVEQMAKYMHKYLNESNTSYNEILSFDSENNKNLNNDLEWSLIIDQAWKIAYRQALEDNNLSPEEKMELESIQSLHRTLKNDPNNRVALNYQVLLSFKNLLAIDNKEDNNVAANKKRWPSPKPTPWDNN